MNGIKKISYGSVIVAELEILNLSKNLNRLM